MAKVGGIGANSLSQSPRQRIEVVLQNYGLTGHARNLREFESGTCLLSSEGQMEGTKVFDNRDQVAQILGPQRTPSAAP